MQVASAFAKVPPFPATCQLPRASPGVRVRAGRDPRCPREGPSLLRRAPCRPLTLAATSLPGQETPAPLEEDLLFSSRRADLPRRGDRRRWSDLCGDRLGYGPVEGRIEVPDQSIGEFFGNVRIPCGCPLELRHLSPASAVEDPVDAGPQAFTGSPERVNDFETPVRRLYCSAPPSRSRSS